jgi:alkaline phosphatase D
MAIRRRGPGREQTSPDQRALVAAMEGWWTPSDPAGVVAPRFTQHPFTLGVASGSPLPDSVVLWTRLAPEPLNGGGMDPEAVAVRWEMATDERFTRVVRRGTVDALPGRGHSVHVEVTGLEPARWYWYRFMAGDEVSRVGRTRTAPAATGNPRQLRFGLGSCQQFEQGYYGAYRHLLDEDVDVMVFVGDYIYESSWGVNHVRKHAGGEPRTVIQYRNRHAQYKSDPDLQAMHAAVPWIVTWDDHEVDNDYADDRSEDLDPAFLTRRSAGYQGYFEHMPLRDLARPRGSNAQLYARYDFGRLARIHVLDGRQYRSHQACPRAGRGGSNYIDARCTELGDPERTMLGTNQERWLQDGLLQTAGRWNVIAQQTLMARAAVETSGRAVFWSDAWDGYPAPRERLLGFVRDNQIRSCVVLSGDAHTNYVCDLKVDFETRRSPIVATEFCGTSITSQGRPQPQTDAIRRNNPHIHLANSAKRGYVVVDLTPARFTGRLRVIDDETRRTPAISTLATFGIAAGQPGAQRG